MKQIPVVRMVLVVLALFFCGVLLARMRSRRPPAASAIGLEAFYAVPAGSIGWSERQPWLLPKGTLRAVAAGGDGIVAVAIDDRIAVLQGQIVAEIAVGQAVHALAIATNNLIAAGLARGAAVYNLHGRRVGQVNDLGEKSRVTSVAIMDDALFMADFGRRCVWKAGFDGTILGQYPGPTPHGFIIPSGYFDLAAGADGLWVVNPGNQELILLDGVLTERARWRREGPSLNGFFGCCNPSHIALMPDGNLVTCEKGVPRIKLYDRHGDWIDMVAQPSVFAGDHGPFDLAVDRNGLLYVLDAKQHRLRIFEHVRPQTMKGEGSDEP